jgi:threonine dehydrogenase-like Zn-dependent dehydrogenase
MKAAVMMKKGELKVIDVPELKPDEYQALVKISHCSICNGTDWKLLMGTFPPPPFAIPNLFPYGDVGWYPGIMGHESVGEVIEVGSKVTKFKKGDKVLRVGAFYPGKDVKFKSYWGGFAEYGLVEDVHAMEKGAPDRVGPINYMQQVVPSDFDGAQATMLITMKEICSAVQNFGVKPKESFFVWGDGPVGLCFARWVKITGAYPVILCGRHDDRLAFALKFGADFVINQKKENVAEKVMKYTDGQGVAKVANAVGTNKLIEDSLDFLANMGTIGMYGLQDTSTPPKPEETTINFGKRIFTWNGWNLGAVGPDEARVHQQVLDAVKFGIFDPKSLITHVMPLAEIREGMELIKQRKALKVVVECGK